ncbi:MAG: trigger factor [Marinicaulis sp.]|nr:trigger factor [Marinicaulis sp.]NNE39454.1 trigger factor [Marinicaulis sp.]NNL90122.1 trigger factor [Marinicaulis sp.]
MEVTEVSAEGLDRKFAVKVSATELDEKLTERLTELKGQVHLKGFRKGKAPVSFLKKMYGKGVMGEIVQEIVTETSQKAFTDRDLQPAMAPHPHFHSDMDDVIAGKSDLEYDVHAEILPEIEPMDVATLKLVRPVAEVPAEEIDEAIERIAEQQTSYTPRKATQKSKKKDMVNVDYVGTIDGEEFAGGKGEGVDLVLGSGTFIPGFEDQLTDVKEGDQVDVKVTFPEDYNAEDLAGKDAIFAVTVKEVKEPEAVAIDDELAKKVGLDSLDDLKARLRERMEGDYKQQSRAHVKRALLDRLDEAHEFELPNGMVDAEFKQIWEQVQASELDDEDKEKSEDELKDEYRKIAERRVRLGLVLAEIGKRADVSVPQEDLQREMINMARAYPGQEKEVLEFYQNNPAAVQQLRAPLFEEKVVDYILERCEVEDKTVSKDELMKDPDGE